MILLALIGLVLLAVMNAAPLAFCAMLMLGNVGVNLGFWAVLPGALAVKFAIHNVFSVSPTPK